MHVFGSSGVRGVAGEELTPQDAIQVAQAAGSVWATNTDRVAVARDTRTTGRTYENAVTSGFTGLGFDVDRLGIVPTPGLQAYCEAEGVPGLMVTASHNPPAYNGVKLIGASGVELSLGTLERVEERLLSEDYATVPWDDTGAETRVENARRAYVDQLLTAVDRDRIADGNLTVALDPGHGAGALTSPDFFRELGCEVVTVNAQADGHFPGRPSEPVESNLRDLESLVRAADADVGIAHDGDADRAVFVDERGEFVAGEASLAALAAAELDAGDTAVAAVNVSQRLVDVCDDAGATLELTPIGATNIITRIR